MQSAKQALELARWPDRYRLLVWQFAEIMEADGVPCDKATAAAIAAFADALRNVRLWPAVYAEAVSRNV